MTTQAHAWVADTDWGRELIGTFTAEAKAEGKIEGQRAALERELANQARTLLAVLETRGIAVDAAARDRIGACTDTDLLSECIVRAATATTIGDVLT